MLQVRIKDQRLPKIPMRLFRKFHMMHFSRYGCSFFVAKTFMHFSHEVYRKGTTADVGHFQSLFTSYKYSSVVRLVKSTAKRLRSSTSSSDDSRQTSSSLDRRKVIDWCSQLYSVNALDDAQILRLYLPLFASRSDGSLNYQGF